MEESFPKSHVDWSMQHIEQDPRRRRSPSKAALRPVFHGLSADGPRL